LLRILILALAALPAFAQNATFRANNYAVNCSGTSTLYTGDFDGDGKLDLAVQCDGQISIMLGNGNGTLQGARAFMNIPNRSTPATGEMIVAADFNHDGKTDLGIQEVTSNGVIFQVLLSNGDGTFKAPVTTQVFADPKAPVGVDFAADLNGDGAADLILHYGNAVGLMMATGNGGFTSLVVLVIQGINAVAVADLTGDGVLDVLASDASGNHQIIVGKGDGTFSGAYGAFSVATSGKGSYVFGDFNGDGNLDIGVAASSASCTGCFYAALGNGRGNFQAPVKTTARSTALAAADFNDDGRTDIVQDATELGALAVLFGNNDGTMKASGLVNVGGVPSSIFTADLDGDGKPDVISLHTIQGQNPVISLLLNTTPGASRVKSIVNGASFATSQAITAGSLVSLKGNLLSSGVPVQAAAIPLPTSLGGTSVTFNGILAPLLYVSQAQINAQVPWKLQAVTATVVVTVNGVALPPFSVSLGQFSPAIFTLESGVGPGIAINQDGTVAASAGSIPGIVTRPAKYGEVIFILATGLGAVDLSIADGAASGDALRYTATKPRVLIGGASAQVLFSGLSPQFAGVNQINVVVPDGADTGVVPVQISIGGITSTDKVTMAVQKP
jgi:uncharacterized protein (TIGR03437 family)